MQESLLAFAVQLLLNTVQEPVSKRNARVSHLADKQMKTLLDLSAKSAIQYDKELREYYLKRTEGGKSKMKALSKR